MVLKVREALDAYATMDPTDADALVGKYLTVTIGETSEEIKIVDANDFLMWMEYHYHWLFTHTSFDPEDIDAPEKKFGAFARLWNQYYSRKVKAVQDWIVDIYTKLDPLVTGWERVNSETSFENFGYTDTYNKYVISNNRNGKYQTITFTPASGSAKPDVSVAKTPTADDLKTTTTGNAATTTTSKLAGDVDTPASAVEDSGVTRGTLTAGDTPTTKVWQGTFQSTAISQELPEINEQQNTGETAAKTSMGSQDATNVKGSVLRDGADLGTIDHDQHGVQKGKTDKEANTGNIIERMKEYIKFDIAKELLDGFYDECTFYVDCCQNDTVGDVVWL